MEQPAFRAVLDWWESATAVLGVAAGTVTQSEVEECLERASGQPQGSASLATPLLERERQERRERRMSREAGGSRRVESVPEGSQESPTDTATPRVRRVNSVTDEKAAAAANEERDGIPGLDFIYRLMAPRHLMVRYEELEQEVDSTKFKLYSPEEQAEVRQQLQEVQAAIEQRENRMNILAAAVGGLHGAYVGTMASMLAIFVPQICPATPEEPIPHTCNLYENTHDLTLLNQAVLALNALTLVMMLLTEYSVFRRETWLDTTLSYNPRKAARHLSMPGVDGGPSLLQQHPYIAHQLLWQNLTAGNLARATICMVLVNLLISSVLILGFYNDGARSSIMLVTNTMLLGSKLLWAAIICLQARAGTACCASPCADMRRYTPRRARTTSRACRCTRRCASTSTSSTQTSSKAKVRLGSSHAPVPLRPTHRAAVAEYMQYKDKYTWEQVQEEYAKVASAEAGNVKVMAAQAKEVIKHVVVGRQTTTNLRGLGRRKAGAQDDNGETPPETPASPRAAPSGSPPLPLSAKSGARPRDPARASPAEENA